MIAYIAHFLVDFCFQTEATAVTKHSNTIVRAWHCFWYASLITATLITMSLAGTPDRLLTCWLWLWTSHYALDSYIPCYLLWLIRSYDNSHTPPDFKNFCSTSLGTVWLVVVDQTLHVGCLWLLIEVVR